ncbi:5-hydroxytryptamine receptor 3A-like [Notolabrus celidotus]|uniref:5-hydroxytryptamine receptor 3A-like n=1 Tax=Notolabrus celidotus TaxID=1203425 RepID=UPI00149044F4|nr:5-hydroxytryptamine receptor 3A-like [Notolabrus celidotus]
MGRTEKDKISQTPYLNVVYGGRIRLINGMVLVSTCKMNFYKFPFDTQNCSLTFRSIQHDYDEIKLLPRRSNKDILNKTRKDMKDESEWLLMNVTVETKEVYSFNTFRSLLIYTVTIKRRSVLYVVNFILPIQFFLFLDLASFLISESGGEKLSFKVTVMLAVTVMQLILNDILPSSSDRIPLIAIYCIGAFGFMMLSLLETILMMYLKEKDDVSQDKEADEDQSPEDNCGEKPGRMQKFFRDVYISVPCRRVFDVSPGEMPPELLPEVQEVSSSQLTEESHDSENLFEELREVLKTVALLLSSRKEEEKPGYWTRMTKTINRIYFMFYFISTTLFHGVLFAHWFNEENNWF